VIEEDPIIDTDEWMLAFVREAHPEMVWFFPAYLRIVRNIEKAPTPCEVGAFVVRTLCRVLGAAGSLGR
jgi:hypothetical protein